VHIVLCKTALGSDRKSGGIGSSNRKEKEPSLFTYNTCTIDAQYQYVQSEIVIILGLKPPLNKTHLN